MLSFEDKPYEYYPPKPGPFWILLFQYFTRYIGLPSFRHKIKAVVLKNREVIDTLVQGGKKRIFFLPNHSTHSDPQVMMEVQRQLGLYSTFMAAQDVFQRGKVRAWVMQHSGAFSIDRQGSDAQSMKQATKILVEGKYPLTIFPEGNVYFLNDWVTPFLEGAAYIAMRAQKEIGEQESIYAVPVSLKFTYLDDVRKNILAKMKRLAKIAGVELDFSNSPKQELIRMGVEILKNNLAERGYKELNIRYKDLASFIAKAAETVIRELEVKIGLTPKEQDKLTERIRKVRRTIHQLRIDSENSIPLKEMNELSDKAMLVLRILSYSGQYISDKATIDRLGETAEKLLEDVSSKASPAYGRRSVYVSFSEPIALKDYLPEFKIKSRQTLFELTQTLETSVQKGLDLLNEENSNKGAEVWPSF